MGRSRQRSLHAGDNLEVLAGLEADLVELIYLDPPFNSGRAFEAVVGQRRGGDRLSHRADGFDDSWGWTAETEVTLRQITAECPAGLALLVQSLVRSLGRTDLSAYLIMMAPRLVAAHRVLTASGSMYLHCDPAASHYLKVLLDEVFGPENFRNEIIWKRTHAHSSSRRYGPIHDVILYYTKSNRYTWNKIYSEYERSYIDNHFTHEDAGGRYQLITCTAPGDRFGTKAHYVWNGQYPPAGRHWAWKREQMEEFERDGTLVHSTNGVPRLKRYVQDGAGVPLQDLWTDINRLDAHSLERVGYETQKPLALLDRIVLASSNPGDLIVDPFCGAGTTLVAAERHGRQWIGADKSLLACSISLGRVRQEADVKAVTLTGFPADEASARQLYRTDPITFGMWGTAMLGTLADRKAFNGSVAAGSGCLKSSTKRLELVSWVPLRDQTVGTLPAVRHKRLTRVGFLLQTGRGHIGLKSWLEQRTKYRICDVELKELVEDKSLRRGMSDRVVSEVTVGQ